MAGAHASALALPRHLMAMSHTRQNMLYLDCQLDPARLTDHLRGTRKSEHKKKPTAKARGMHYPYSDMARPHGCMADAIERTETTSHDGHRA